MAIFSCNPNSFVKEISVFFQVKDLGSASLILGMKVTQSEDTILLLQEHYIDQLIAKYEEELSPL